MIVIIVLALALAALAWHRGVAKEGLVSGAKLLWDIGPILIPAFLLAGMASVLIPAEALARWLGEGSGLRGLAVGTATGALAPGGPFILFPLLAVLLQKGASVGVVTAFMTSWALLGIHRIAAFEVPLMGWRFTIVRVVVSAVFPMVIGGLAQLVWTRASG